MTFVSEMRISVLVACSGLDADGVADLTAELRQEVLTTDVDSAELADGPEAPRGAKAGDLVDFGALAITLAPTVLESLLGVIASWLSRQPADVEVEIDGHRFRGHVTKAQRDQLVTAYLNRVNNGS